MIALSPANAGAGCRRRVPIMKADISCMIHAVVDLHPACTSERLAGDASSELLF